MTPIRGRVFDVGDDVVLEADGPWLTAVRAPRDGDPAPTPGLIVPGLINAHLHLELSGFGSVAGGDGLHAWVNRLFQARKGAPDGAARAAAAMFAAGTAAVSDVANAAGTGEILAAAGLQGIVHREVLGFDADTLPDRIAALADYGADYRGPNGVIRERPSPHAPYSTAPSLLVAAVRARPGVPATVHLAEDTDELEFLGAGTGQWAALLDRLGRDWRWWDAPHLDPVSYLDELGVLGPELLLVHAVHLGGADPTRLAAARAPVVLCLRSNLHITGRHPDAPALVRAGVRLALGTDSLASCPDLDVLGEVVALGRAFREVPAAVWLRAATAGGADALGLPHLGRIAVGAAPGLLVLDVDDVDEIVERGDAARRWLLPPGPSERV